MGDAEHDEDVGVGGLQQFAIGPGVNGAAAVEIDVRADDAAQPVPRALDARSRFAGTVGMKEKAIELGTERGGMARIRAPGEGGGSRTRSGVGHARGATMQRTEGGRGVVVRRIEERHRCQPHDVPESAASPPGACERSAARRPIGRIVARRTRVVKRRDAVHAGWWRSRARSIRAATPRAVGSVAWRRLPGRLEDGGELPNEPIGFPILRAKIVPRFTLSQAERSGLSSW